MDGLIYFFFGQAPRGHDASDVERVEVADVTQLASQPVQRRIPGTFGDNAVPETKDSQEAVYNDTIGDAIVIVGEGPPNPL